MTIGASSASLSANLDTATIHNTDRGQLLDIVIGSERFSPESTGLWNLNEIHKRLNLPESKEPSEWRTKVSRHLREAAHLQTIVGGSGGGNTFATEEAAVAYAMWVSIEFYSMVVQAFLTMRTQAVIEAKTKAIHQKAFMAKLIKQGVSWREACRNAGITNPDLAKGYLVRFGILRVNPRHVIGQSDPQYLLNNNKGEGLFKVVRDRYNKEGFRVLLSGFNRLKVRASEINEYTASI